MNARKTLQAGILFCSSKMGHKFKFIHPVDRGLINFGELMRKDEGERDLGDDTSAYMLRLTNMNTMHEISVF